MHTPPASLAGPTALPDLPAPALPHRLTGPFRSLLTVWFEPQDRSGTAALATYALSALSTTAALALSLGLLPFNARLWTAAAWFLHHFSWPLAALPISLGFASRRGLPRGLAWYTLTLATVYYGWHWLPFAFSPSTLIKALYIAAGAVVALPALLRRPWRGRLTVAFQITDAAAREQSVVDAIATGYRLIDRAASQLDEEAVARGTRPSSIPRPPETAFRARPVP